MAAVSDSSLFPDGMKPTAPVDVKPKKRLWAKMKTSKVKLPAIGDVTWAMVWQGALDFLKDPINVALLVWVLLSVPACVAIMMVKLGIFNHILSPHVREEVDEVATQVVNALFMLTCLIIFPLLCRHTYLLIRWQASDKIELRQAFCKNGKRKPHDRTHIAVVVAWGQVTCWATFGFAAIYWIYPLGDRPLWLTSTAFVLSMVAPVISFLYLLLSPLSKDYDVVKEGDEEMLRMYERSHAFFVSHRQVQDAQWEGTVFPGCCTNRRIACLTCLFPCCMFGYNMERLGFGHKVVHTMAFIIVLFGPVLVFKFSASSLEELGVAPRIIYYCGVLLAMLGLAYGGAWRMKMRETYHLPGSTVCCGSKRATDICTWIWCSYCALCQEIRTVDQYQVEETSYPQALDAEAGGPAVVAPEGDEDFEQGATADTAPPCVQAMEAEPREGMKVQHSVAASTGL